MLNDAAASIPYPTSAAKYAALQSRTARLSAGLAVRSVRQLPSAPPAKLDPDTVAVNPPLVVVAASVFASPARPIVRAVIVSTLPAALAHTPV